MLHLHLNCGVAFKSSARRWRSEAVQSQAGSRYCCGTASAAGPTSLDIMSLPNTRAAAALPRSLDFRWWFFVALPHLEAEQLVFGWNVDGTHLSGSVHGFDTHAPLPHLTGAANSCFVFSSFFVIKLRLLKCLGFVRGTFPSCCASLDLGLETSTDATKCAKFSTWGKSDQLN